MAVVMRFGISAVGAQTSSEDSVHVGVFGYQPAQTR
jgi:hypothetical protein